jgi:protocatechuate 3,4-dioxygenase beta subunit
MTRREALFTLGAGLLSGEALQACRTAQVLTTLPARPVEPGFVRMWLAAQAARPAVIPRAARIGPVGEPGTPLVVRGRLYHADGQQTVPDAVIFAYQTDRNGLYNVPGERGWRLTGWAKTDADGSFEFTTIRPAPYPSRDIAAHIHLSADGPSIARQILGDVRFADDPLLTAGDRRAAARAGRFTDLCPVTVERGVERCEMLFRLTGEYVF